VKALQLIGRKEVLLSDLRPGCLGRPEILNTKFDLSSDLDEIQILTWHIQSIVENDIPCCTSGRMAGVSLCSKFGIFKCFRDQFAIDGIFVASSNLRIISQSKTLPILKNDGTPSNAKLFLSRVFNCWKDIQTLLIDAPSLSIIEIFTDHRSTISVDNLPDSTILISSENWLQAVGPIFGERLRFMSSTIHPK
jgi:hypothetical protein